MIRMIDGAEQQCQAALTCFETMNATVTAYGVAYADLGIRVSATPPCLSARRARLSGTICARTKLSYRASMGITMVAPPCRTKRALRAQSSANIILKDSRLHRHEHAHA